MGAGWIPGGRRRTPEEPQWASLPQWSTKGEHRWVPWWHQNVPRVNRWIAEGSSVELMEPGRNSTGPPVDPRGAAMDPLGATVDRWGASVDPSGAPGIPKGPPVDHLGAPVEPTEPQGDSMGPAVDSMVAPGCGAGQTRAGPHPAGARAAWGPIFAKSALFAKFRKFCDFSENCAISGNLAILCILAFSALLGPGGQKYHKNQLSRAMLAAGAPKEANIMKFRLKSSKC